MQATMAMRLMGAGVTGGVAVEESRYQVEVTQRLRSLDQGRFTGVGTNGAGKKEGGPEQGRFLLEGVNGDGRKENAADVQVEIESRLKQVTGQVCK